MRKTAFIVVCLCVSLVFGAVSYAASFDEMLAQVRELASAEDGGNRIVGTFIEDSKTLVLFIDHPSGAMEVDAYSLKEKTLTALARVNDNYLIGAFKVDFGFTNEKQDKVGIKKEGTFLPATKDQVAEAARPFLQAILRNPMNYAQCNETAIRVLRELGHLKGTSI